MKKQLTLLLGLSVCLVGSFLTGCSSDSTITVCASELPHAKILKECISPILKEKGYSLEVTVLDWKIQNDSVAKGDYDANYFQHVPYLNEYNGSVELAPVCKVHYEKLCLYASDVNNKILDNGETIELVNDPSNIERALLLLQEHGILTINSSNYNDKNEFKNFNISNPNSCVTFTENYSNCTLTCISESQLCASLPDYNFGIIPGNTALTGLKDTFTSRIVFGEEPTNETISERANIIAVKKSNINSKKTLALAEAFADQRVGEYISTNFGESVLYHYENLLNV